MFKHDKTSSFLNWTPKKQQEKNLIRWIEALISGDYQQVSGALYQSGGTEGDHFCATGVAADAVGKFKRIRYKRFWLPFKLGVIQLSSDGFYFGFEADELADLCSNGFVPHNWFWRTFGAIGSPNVWQRMNDKGKSFVEIAAALTEFLPSSIEKTDLQFRIAKKMESERLARQTQEQNAPRTVAQDGKPSEGYFNYP